MSGKIEISRELASYLSKPLITQEDFERRLDARDVLRALLAAEECCHEFVPFQPACVKCGERYVAAPVVERQAVRPVVWRIPVNGDWFYGTKEQCEREYAEYTADFTAEDFDEAGPVQPEPLACLDKVKELNQ